MLIPRFAVRRIAAVRLVRDCHIEKFIRTGPQPLPAVNPQVRKRDKGGGLFSSKHRQQLNRVAAVGGNQVFVLRRGPFFGCLTGQHIRE